MTFYIAPIVEGHTEDDCIEPLLHRVWNDLLQPPFRLQVLQPSRGNRDSLVRPNHPDLALKVTEAYRKLAQRLKHDPASRGLLLLLIDAEGDCPAVLGPRLLRDMRAVRPDTDISCVLAKRMFENWLVAGASTLAGVNGLPNPLPDRERVEEQNGWRWFDDQFRGEKGLRKYKKKEDAKVFVQFFSPQECRDNCPSFDKLCRDLEARLSPPPPAE
jgi:hypothetical protein